MPITNYNLSNYPFMANRTRGAEAEGYQYITPLIHAVALRAVYSQNSSALTALQQGLGASAYTNVSPQQGLGAYTIFRFPSLNSVLLVMAGLNNSTDNANLIRLSDFTATPDTIPAKLEDFNPKMYFQTAMYNYFNSTYKSALYTAAGYSTVSHTQGPNLSITGHGAGAGYALLLLNQMYNDAWTANDETPMPIMPVSLFGMPNCANRSFARLVDRNAFTWHYFNQGDVNITRPTMNRQVSFAGVSIPFGQSRDTRTPPIALAMCDITQRPMPARPAGMMSFYGDYFNRVEQQAAPPPPVNGWQYPSTIEAYVNNLFALAVQPSNASVVQQLQGINALIDAIPYTMGGTNPPPVAPVLPTANIAPQVSPPVTPSNTVIPSITPAPSVIGGQLTLRAVDTSVRPSNAYKGYDRRLLQTTIQALGNQIHRDDLLDFTNSRVPSNGSPIWDFQDTDLMAHLDAVLAHIATLLNETNVVQ